jgi:hypothetical protein
MKKERPDSLTTLKIDKVTHSRIKRHCVENDYYIHLFVEDVINKYLNMYEGQQQKRDRIKTMIENRKQIIDEIERGEYVG